MEGTVMHGSVWRGSQCGWLGDEGLWGAWRSTFPSQFSQLATGAKKRINLSVSGYNICIFSSPLPSTVGSKNEEGFELRQSGKITTSYIPWIFFKTGFWLIFHFSQSTQLLASQLDDICTTWEIIGSFWVDKVWKKPRAPIVVILLFLAVDITGLLAFKARLPQSSKLRIGFVRPPSIAGFNVLSNGFILIPHEIPKPVVGIIVTKH